jgi:hypothetical protein
VQQTAAALGAAQPSSTAAPRRTAPRPVREAGAKR